MSTTHTFTHTNDTNAMKKKYAAPSLTVVEMGTIAPLASSPISGGVKIEENEDYAPAQTFSVKSPWQAVEADADDEEDF